MDRAGAAGSVPRPEAEFPMSDNRLPSLNAVRTFVSAGRHLSFTAAAAELNVTQGAVSRLVKALEEDLGVDLFQRVGRGLKLTPEGAAYLEAVTGALARIAAATRAVRRAGDRGVLSVSVLPTFAMRWLVPRLGRFQAAFPEILVDMTIGDGPVEFETLSADLAIRFGTGPFAGAEARPLMGEEMAVVAAPGLIAALPPIRSVADLPPARLLRHTTRPGAWAHYFAAAGLTPPEPGPAPAFEHFFLLAEAASAGLGIALMPLFLVERELAAGRLVQPLPQTLRSPGHYQLLAPEGAGWPRKARLFADWLAKEAASAGLPVA